VQTLINVKKIFSMQMPCQKRRNKNRAKLCGGVEKNEKKYGRM